MDCRQITSKRERTADSANVKGTSMKANLFTLSLFLAVQMGGSGLFAQKLSEGAALQLKNNDWNVPNCPLDTSGRIGGMLIPKSAKVKSSFDHADTYVNKIYYGSGRRTEIMLIMSGPFWGIGELDKDLIESSSEIHMGNIKGDHFQGRYYWGRDKEGFKWRRIYHQSNTIEYTHVSEKAAEYYDAIIDSLCCYTVPKLSRPDK
jgi:hypothetical protein